MRFLWPLAFVVATFSGAAGVWSARITAPNLAHAAGVPLLTNVAPRLAGARATERFIAVPEGFARATPKGVISAKEGAVNVVLLSAQTEAGTVVIPMFVSEAQAKAITEVIHAGTSGETSGSSIEQIVTSFGGRVRGAMLEKMDGTNMLGRLLLADDQRQFAVPLSGPDSVAAALAEGAPIFVSRELMDSVGLTHDDIQRMHDKITHDHGGPDTGDVAM